jgi:hypothetical protein
MSIFVPLILVVMPMNIDIGPFLLVLAVLSAISVAGLCAGRDAAAEISSDATLHRSRVEAVRELFAVARDASPPSPKKMAAAITGRIATAS